MPGFILCPECSENIGEVCDFIQFAKQGYYQTLKKEFSEVLPEKLVICPDITKPIGFILDAVGLTNLCCRMHILGTTNFDNIYK
jgi:DNA-directed RNA polymerase subunit N (RpoN/RPB10)